MGTILRGEKDLIFEKSSYRIKVFGFLATHLGSGYALITLKGIIRVTHCLELASTSMA